MRKKERGRQKEREREREERSNSEEDREYRVRRWNVAGYKATWRARLHWQKANVRTVGRTEHAGYTQVSRREVPETQVREESWKHSRKRRPEREENPPRERPIHLGAPSMPAIGPSWVRPRYDWTALFTSWCPGALQARRREGGTERRDKRRHYCKGLHLAGRGL